MGSLFFAKKTSHIMKPDTMFKRRKPMLIKILKTILMVLGAVYAFGLGCFGYAKVTKNEEIADSYEEIGKELKYQIISD